MTQTLTTAQPIGEIVTNLKFKPISNDDSRSSTDTKVTCSTCQSLDTCPYEDHPGFRLVTDDNGIIALNECTRHAQWRLKARQSEIQRRGTVPKQYRQLTFADFKVNDTNGPALVEAMQLRSMYLSGPPGAGKTLLLSLIANEHARNGTEVHYVTAPELLLQVRYNVESCEQRIYHYQEVPVLLIDDLGAERHNNFSEEQLYMILDGRQRYDVITVIASAVPISALPYHERTIDRIKRTTEREAHLASPA